MSRTIINQYYNNIDRALQYGKSKNETAVRNYFWMLLNHYAKDNNYEVIPEVSTMGTKGSKVYPDGIVKNLWGLDVGLWESKDETDDINEEIDKKIKKGYPLTNILFEDTNTAVLFQRGERVMSVPVRNADNLDTILRKFFNFKSETVYKFEDAIEKFKEDIPVIIEKLRSKIEEVGLTKPNYISVRDSFLSLCKAEINPEITLDDIREMMIQHLLTSDIFNKIFDDPDFHRHNTIAAELEKLIDTLFTYSERRNLLGSIEHYYDTINSTAAAITDHHEKQKFLKVLYENFYKSYNPKAADRLGVIYTPNEIVRFMIESTNHLLYKHFGKTLSDKNVDILDPATGTGTFITEIIENTIPKQDLAYKYKNEIHANEVAILPYYIASLNIEYTYKQKMGYFEEFSNICFVDTLDNTLPMSYGKQTNAFSLTSENTERIKKQNERKISVIIGNPPYNANQKNENENNKNREYPEIDKRIKDTYIKNSTAQKTKLYDMYSRFLRWASDRIDKNGIIAFVSNSSFIDSRTYDGFRKVISQEFNELHIIDLKGNARTSGERRRKEGGNIFSDLIRVGVAVYFLVKKEGENGFKVYYNVINDYEKAEEKKEYLKSHKLKDIDFAHIIPDKDNNWINLAENDLEGLLPLYDKSNNHNSLLNLVSIGVSTNRDEWVFDFSEKTLLNKMRYFIESYNSKVLNNENDFDDEKMKDIKWSDSLKNKFKNKLKLIFTREYLTSFHYRPFTNVNYYADKNLSDRLTNNHFEIHGLKLKNENIIIGFSGVGSSKAFSCLATNQLIGVDYLEKTQCISLYRYDSNDNRIENITDWGLEQFQKHYKDKKIKKEDIFNYIYAVLHNPEYRKKYEINLKREFPRIPFYENFKKWCNRGKRLMELHINFESAEPYKLKVKTSETKAEHLKEKKQIFEEVKEPDALLAYKPKVKTKLTANKEKGTIEIDELTTLSGIPKEAWEYKLGNRSALEWILDQYKEKKPKDPTIREKFNTYKFADYKNKVIDLLMRVCTVSVETMKIVKEMAIK